MPVREELLQQLDNEIKTARVNLRYHEELERGAQAIDWWVRILGAVTSVSAISTIFAEGDLRQLWSIFTAVVAGLTAAATVIAPSETGLRHASLRRGFIMNRNGLRALSRQVEANIIQTDDAFLQRFDELMAQRASLEEEQPPADRRVLARSQVDVIIGSGTGPASPRLLLMSMPLVQRVFFGAEYRRAFKQQEKQLEQKADAVRTLREQREAELETARHAAKVAALRAQEAEALARERAASAAVAAAPTAPP